MARPSVRGMTTRKLVRSLPRIAALGSALLITLAVATPVRASLPAPVSGQPSPLHFTALHPGHPTLRPVRVHVNVVVVGYSATSVDTARLVSLLPTHGVPLEDAPAWHGYGYPAGDELTYDYRVATAGAAFEDAFFGHLAKAGTVGPPDAFQGIYNSQTSRSVTVGPQVRYIDAQDTESWLERHAASALGIDRRDYTVFLVNWYGRPDFQFHTYTNLGAPDPDSGIDLRATLSDTDVRAWGGSSGPTWFLDLSAGPVWADGSFLVDNANITGTPETDDRIPPVWDYGHVGYRAFDDLTGDLAKVIRYVAIDSLFAASPLYDVFATEPLPGGGKQIALDLFEGAAGVNGLDRLHVDAELAQLHRLQPYIPIGMSVSDRPLVGDPLKAYEIGSLASSEPDCWTPYGAREVEFECHFLGNYPSYFPFPTGGDSVIPEVGFTVADDPSARRAFQGSAEGDGNGTPALVEMFDDAPLRAAVEPFGSYGYTQLSTHETAHFLGLAHPHDGYDPESRLFFSPRAGEFFFTWMGGESDTLMSYLPGNQVVDAFDIANLARNVYARAAGAADYYAGVLLAQPPNAAVNKLLSQADTSFHLADVAIGSERWLDAGTAAETGFMQIARALQIDGLLPSSAATAASPARRAGSVGDLTMTPHVTAPTQAFRSTPGAFRCIVSDRCGRPPGSE